MPFRALGLGDGVLRAIQDAGYSEPTPIQSAAIPLVLGGHDLIGIAQTGTGKTAAFTLPMLTQLNSPTPSPAPAPAPTPASGPVAASGAGSAPGPALAPARPAGASQRRGIRALILAPTRELVVQIEENVRAYGKHLPLRRALVYGGVGEQPQIQALRTADIVIATPGRLLDLMSRGYANFSGLRMLVLDEADRMLDMGFLPDMRRIVAALPQKRQTLLFSATLSREIEEVTRQFLHAPKLVQIGRRANPAETVTQFVYEVPHHLKTTLLVHLLNDSAMDMVLVFSRTKHGADRIARQLQQQGIRTETLHSNRSQSQRLHALKDFKSGVVRVLVATDIAARGIDVDGISHVVNYDFPPHAEDYVHRIGRTGRAHAVGDAISFVTPDDYGSLRSLERFLGRGLIRKRAENLSQTLLKVPPPAHPPAALPRPQREPREERAHRDHREQREQRAYPAQPHKGRPERPPQRPQPSHPKPSRQGPSHPGPRPTRNGSAPGRPSDQRPASHRPPAPSAQRPGGADAQARPFPARPFPAHPSAKANRPYPAQDRGGNSARPRPDGNSLARPPRPWRRQKWNR